MGAGASGGGGTLGSENDIVGGVIDVEILSARDLLAADGGWFGKKSSDPYCRVSVCGVDGGPTHKYIHAKLEPADAPPPTCGCRP